MSKLTTGPLDAVRIFRFVLAVFGIALLLIFGFKAASTADDITAVGGRAVKSFVSLFTSEPAKSNGALTEVDATKASEASKLPEAPKNQDANAPSQAQSTTNTANTSTPRSVTAPGAQTSVEASGGASLNGHDGVNNGSASTKETNKLSDQVRAVLKDALMMP